MAKMMDKCPDEYQGESKVWNCIKDNLPEEIVCYHNREVNGREFDFCLVVKDIGLFIIEVKGWNKSHIHQVVSPDEIKMSNGDVYSSPKKQARAYCFSLLNKLSKMYDIHPLVMDLVCYPFLSQDDYNALGLRIVSEPEYTLFAEDICNPTLFGRKLMGVFNSKHNLTYTQLENEVYDAVRHHFEPTYIVKPPMPTAIPYSALSFYAEPMTIMTVSEIIDSYFKGTKQNIFTNNADDLLLLSKMLTESFVEKHIKVVDSNLELGATIPEESDVIVESGRISIFNFEATYIKDYSISSSFIIYNGNIDDSQWNVVNSIAAVSSFNIKQYMVEHAPINRDIEVRAGAGTGKTYSMVSRIAYLCHPSTNSRVFDVAEEIAMLTFTADAATNMKSRLKKFFINSFVLTGNVRFLEMVNGIEKMRISTIHSFAKEIIQNTSSAVGIGSTFSTISGSYEKQKIFDRYFTAFLQRTNQVEPIFYDKLPMKIDDFRKNLLKFSDLLYNKGCDIKHVSMNMFGKEPEEIPYFNDLIENVIIATEKEFTEQCFEDNCIPLSEYMIYLNQCIKSDEFNTNLFNIKYMFIDEFQDTDDAQINAFHNMQIKLGFNFFIVGDLKQSIYRFRGATMSAFDQMHTKGSNWLEYSLNQNYRSDSRMLKQFEIVFSNLGASNYLPYKSGRDELLGVKTFSDYKDDDVLCNIVITKDDKSDTEQYFDYFFDLIESEKNHISNVMKNRRLSDKERTIAILMRNNSQIVQLLREAKKRNVAVESDSSSDLYSLVSSKDLCKLTTALSNPYNLSYLYALIDSNYINAELKLSELLGKSEDEKLDYMTSILDSFYSSCLGKTWGELVNDARSQPILKVLHLIYEKTAPWNSFSKDESRREYYRINYELVFEEITNYSRKNYLTLDAVNEMLHINIITGTEAKSRELNSDSKGIKVICTTVHKSKGLEYGVVILPNTDLELGKRIKNSIDITFDGEKIGYCLTDEKKNEICNQYYSSDAEIMENRMEESRILYVAMTRAINKFVWYSRSDSSELTWGSMLKELENYANKNI